MVEHSLCLLLVLPFRFVWLPICQPWYIQITVYFNFFLLLKHSRFCSSICPVCSVYVKYFLMVLIKTRKKIRITFCCRCLALVFFCSLFGVVSKLCTGCSQNCWFVFSVCRFFSSLHCYHVFCVSNGIDFVQFCLASRETERKAQTLEMKTGKPTNKTPTTQRRMHIAYYTGHRQQQQENE